MCFGTQSRQRALHERGLVGARRVDESAMARLGGGTQKIGGVVRDHRLTTLVALGGSGSVRILHGNRRSLRRTEADGDETDSLIARMFGFGDHVVDVLKSLSIAHEDECFVGAA